MSMFLHITKQSTANGLHGMNGHLVLLNVELVQDHKKDLDCNNQPLVESPVKGNLSKLKTVK